MVAGEAAVEVLLLEEGYHVEELLRNDAVEYEVVVAAVVEYEVAVVAVVAVVAAVVEYEVVVVVVVVVVVLISSWDN